MGIKEIYLAGGCFWGVQAYFKQVIGIVNTEVGYANGYSNQTNYYVIHSTNHAETLKIEYEENSIHFAEILDRYYRIIDPLSINKQGSDVGTQYRTGIFYTDEKQKNIAEISLKILQKKYDEEIQILLQPLKNYVRAEEYHQEYLDKNPDGYCHVDTDKVADMLYPARYNLTHEEIVEKYGEMAHNVVHHKGTETPFTSEYDKLNESGIYVDIVTGQPLFSSDDKYDAGCGWPSFTMPITTDVLKYNEDMTLGMERTEVTSVVGNSHLGHVFDDGPENLGGFRYCINGASLKFIPKDKMAEEGHEELIPYVTK